jgi:hypothetical protein
MYPDDGNIFSAFCEAPNKVVSVFVAYFTMLSSHIHSAVNTLMSEL